jgi:hypothetical protein
VDVYPAELAVEDLALPDMDPGPDPDTERAHRVAHRARAPDGRGRGVEGGEEPVAGGVELTTCEMLELDPDHTVMPGQELPPPPVAHLLGHARRSDDVGEQQRSQDASLPPPGHVGSLPGMRWPCKGAPPRQRKGRASMPDLFATCGMCSQPFEVVPPAAAPSS